MKKVLFLFVLASLAIFSTVSAQTCDCESLQAQIDALTARIEALESGTVAAAAEEPDAETSIDFEPVTIGDYTVELIGWELGKAMYQDFGFIKITYRFTNNSQETASYGWKIGCKAFQDGIELASYLFSDGDRTTDIRPGKSIEVREGFKIRNDQSEIELEFIPFLSSKAVPEVRVIDLK